jgi:hypothetical protein
VGRVFSSKWNRHDSHTSKSNDILGEATDETGERLFVPTSASVVGRTRAGNYERRRIAVEVFIGGGCRPGFRWRFRTDIANWNDPPARFGLDVRSKLAHAEQLCCRDKRLLHWRITEVKPGKSFVVAIQLEQATLAFEWRFDELPGSRTKLTQEIVLSGDNAPACAAQVEAGFGSNLPAGMKRIAAEMATAESEPMPEPGKIAL